MRVRPARPAAARPPRSGRRSSRHGNDADAAHARQPSRSWFAALSSAACSPSPCGRRPSRSTSRRVARGPLVVTVDEEGVTRVRDRFVVSAPVSGRVLRIELEPGDRVKRGQVVARVRAEPPPLLDARTRSRGGGRRREREGRARPRSRGRAAGQGRRWSRPSGTSPASARSPRPHRRQTGTRGARGGSDVAQETANAAAFAVRAATSELQRAEARLAPAPPSGARPRGDA